ncbi:MAG: hypothetical protein ACREFX_08945 [Opitutaceae bacterium]
MKSYTFPAFLLLLVSVLLAFGILKSISSAKRAADNLAAERSTVNSDRMMLVATESAAKRAAANSTATDAFLDKWTAELANESDMEEVLGRLDTLAVNGLLSPGGKNFRFDPNYPFEGQHLAVQTVNMTVSGEFYRTLNWLGAAENAYPLARVEQISYTNAGNVLSMAIQFSFPRQFDLK